MEIIYLLVGLLVGFIVGFLIQKLRSKSGENKILEAASVQMKTLAQMEERVNHLQSDKDRLNDELDQAKSQNEQHMQRLAKAEVEFANLREKLVLQKQEMEDLQKKFTTEFENIANKILEKNSEKFTEANKKNIGDILTPLKDKIKDFKFEEPDIEKQNT